MKFDVKSEPPTAHEMLEYLRGDLSAEEEASFRTRVIDYPELLRTLVADFPEPAQPDDPDYLSDEEFARRWTVVRKRDWSHTVVPFWRTVAAVAAAVAVIFATMYWKTRGEQPMPQVFSADAQPLYPDSSARGIDGGSAAAITPAGDAYVLAPVVADERVFGSYQLDLYEAHTARRLWSKSGIRRSADAPLILIIPREFVRPGLYRISLSGVAGAREEHLADY